MPLKELLSPSSKKIVLFGGIVLLQVVLALFGMQCGWSLIHGGSAPLAWACITIVSFFIFPSALLSSGWISGIPYAGTYVAIVLDLAWAYLLSCLILWSLRKLAHGETSRETAKV